MNCQTIVVHYYKHDLMQPSKRKEDNDYTGAKSRVFRNVWVTQKDYSKIKYYEGQQGLFDLTHDTNNCSQ